jgi:hypothetical protein
MSDTTRDSEGVAGRSPLCEHPDCACPALDGPCHPEADAGEKVAVRMADHIWKFGWNTAEFDGEPGTREHCEHLARLAMEALGVGFLPTDVDPDAGPSWFGADEASAWASGWNACVRAMQNVLEAPTPDRSPDGR